MGHPERDVVGLATLDRPSEGGPGKGGRRQTENPIADRDSRALMG
jgi:hypothetical protein